MYELCCKVYEFVFILRLRIKLIPEKEFNVWIKQLDLEQTIYALFFRYC